MGKCFKAATFIKKQQVAALSTLVPVPDLEKVLEGSYPILDNVAELSKTSRKEIYLQLIDGELFLAPPESSKKAKCWGKGFKIILAKDDDNNFFFTGIVIHSCSYADGTYCGWMSRQEKRVSQKKGIRTSDLDDHVRRCKAGSPASDKNAVVSLEEGKSCNQPKIPFLRKKKTVISKRDMKQLNSELKDWIFQHGLPYERLGDMGLRRVLEQAMAIGAKYGRKGANIFDLSESGHRFISPHGCRLSLPSDYSSLLEF